MAEAASLAKVEVMEWLIANHEKIVWSAIYANRAAAAGHLNVLQWLKKYSPDADQHLAGALEHAARVEHVETVKWLYENVNNDTITADIEAEAFYSAIRSGNFATIQYLHEHQLHKSKWAVVRECSPIDEAAKSGDAELLRWLHTNGYRWFNEQRTIRDAVAAGSSGTVLWLIQHSAMDDSHGSAFVTAVSNGHIEIAAMFQLVRRDADWYQDALSGAAANSHLEAVQWLFHHFRSCCITPDQADQDAVARAAGNGHFEIVQWLHAQRCDDTKLPLYDIHDAVVNNHFEVVKWLVENSDRRQYANELDAAVKSGSLEMVRWLHENTDAAATGFAMEYAASKITLIFSSGFARIAAMDARVTQ